MPTFDLEVKMLGSSLAIHIPAGLREEMGLKEGDIVRIKSFQKMKKLLVPASREEAKA